ncbi:MAG: hypothetical protein IJ064_07510 [Bacteroidaceae bacterium]|nr:hypothetical protein [Bacteroidaceae bacterium]
MEDFMEDLAGVLAIALSLGIPIVAIIAGFISSVKKSNNEREIRRLIIENHTDLETAKQLIDEPRKNQGSNPYPALRWGCVLIGMGLGALLCYILQLEPNHDIYFWILIAFGCGLGLLWSFIIEYQLQQRNAPSADETRLTD